MMLDGGGSTQLTCRSGVWIPSDRPVPQAVGVIAAEEPPVSSRLIGHSAWTVIIEGERLPFEAQLENTGRVSWIPSNTSIWIRGGQLEFEENQPVGKIVAPGDTITIHSNISMDQKSGVVPVVVELSIEHDGSRYPANPVSLQAAVLPTKIQDQKSELQAEISRWVISNPDQTAELVEDWIEQALNKPARASELLEPQAINQINPRMWPFFYVLFFVQFLLCWLRAQMVFQEFNLFPHMRVIDNLIEAPVRVKGVPRDQAIATAEKYLDKVGLREKRDEFPARLSGGQKQRVAIARALTMEPKVLLFDEPTSALDPELVGEVLKVMAELAHEGATMIVVTHEMQFAREAADRVYYIEEGHFVEAGPPKSVIDAPADPRTAKFLERLRVK